MHKSAFCPCVPWQINWKWFIQVQIQQFSIELGIFNSQMIIKEFDMKDQIIKTRWQNNNNGRHILLSDNFVLQFIVDGIYGLEVMAVCTVWMCTLFLVTNNLEQLTQTSVIF